MSLGGFVISITVGFALGAIMALVLTGGLALVPFLTCLTGALPS